MKTSHIYRPRYLIIAILGLILSMLSGSSSPAQKDGVLALEPPPFVGAANAAEIGVASIASEAGMSAYFKASTPISLSAARTAFRTIETETADYVIGSVPVPNYGEEWDVHVYVHKDGWILAYYLAEDPAAKILDWKAYHNASRASITTKLENVIAVVADQAAVLFSSATYYDFRYPNATHLMLIVEWVQAVSGGASDTFEVNLPASFVYYERSWSLDSNHGGYTYALYAYYDLNGAQIQYHYVAPGSWMESHGALTLAQLPPGQYHWIAVRGQSSASDCYAYGGLALVYRVP